MAKANQEIRRHEGGGGRGGNSGGDSTRVRPRAPATQLQA